MSDIVFDPSQPFDVVEDNHPSAGTGFDPTKPFSVRNDSPAQTEERQKMARDLEKLQAEKVSDQFSGFEKFIARAGAGVQKAGINAGRMLTAANDVLFLPEITGLFSQRAGDAYRQAVDRDLAYWNKREEDTTRAIQQIDDNSVLGQIVEGTARAIPEMIPQIIPGMAARTAAGAVKASAITGGVYGGMTQYGQERGEGRSQMEALPYAVTSGLITALTTKAFGATGVESVFKKDGVQGIGAKLLNVLKEAGMEGAEEAVDQFQQDLLERAQRNPEKPIGDSIKDVLMAGTIGSLVGGLASGAHTALTAESKPSEFQKALEEGFSSAKNRTGGKRYADAIAFLNQTPRTLGEAADEAQARQENDPLVDLIMKGRNENPQGNVPKSAEGASPTPVQAPLVTEENQAGKPQGVSITAEAIFARNRGETPPDDIALLTDSEAARLFTEKAEGGAPKYSPQVDSVVWGASQSEDKLKELQFLEQAAQARANEVQAETLKLLKGNQPVPPELNNAFLAASGKALWYRAAIEGVKKSGPNYQEAVLRKLITPKETPAPPAAANQPVTPVQPVAPTPAAPVVPPTPPAQKLPVIVSTGKPNGAKAEIEYEVVEAASLKPMIQREVNQDQTRQRVGNIASNEQIAKIATQPDPDLLLESQFSTVGAPIVDDVVIAGNGRVSGLISGYEGSTQGIQNYRRAVVAAASRLGLGDVSNMVNPILIRRVKRYTSGDKSSFVVESNPKYAMLRESVSESAMLDAQALGDISAIPFTDGGALTADGVRRVAQLLDAAQRSLERTTGGDYNASEANRRVQLAALAMMGKQENVPVADFIGLLESDDGRRVIGEVIRMSPRMVRLDADLQIGGRSLAALREFQTGLASVRDKAYNSLAEWYAARRNELLKSGLDENAETILKLMVDSQQKGAVLRAFFDEYITEAEYEQNQRNEAGATADIFGEKRQPKTAAEITNKILNPNAPVAPAASGGQNNPVGGGKGPAAVRPDVAAYQAAWKKWQDAVAAAKTAEEVDAAVQGALNDPERSVETTSDIQAKAADKKRAISQAIADAREAERVAEIEKLPPLEQIAAWEAELSRIEAGYLQRADTTGEAERWFQEDPVVIAISEKLKKLEKLQGGSSAQNFPPSPDLPRSESEVRPGENIFSEFSARMKEWEAAIVEWLKGKPENKAIVWEDAPREINGTTYKGNVYALTRNIGDPKNPWRVTRYAERDGAYMPMGHLVYPTRLKAMLEDAKGSVKTFHDEIPGRVMDEQEIQGYKLMRDIPDKSKLVWYALAPNQTVSGLSERLRTTANMARFVKDSLKDGRVAFTEPVDGGSLSQEELLKHLGLSEVVATPEPKAVEPFSVGSKVRVRNNPQPHTVLRETTDPKYPDERIFEIQNDRTKEKFEIEQASLTPISERTAEERESTKPKTKKELQDELLKLNPALRPSIKDFKTTKQLRDAIKRERSKLAGDEPAANLGVGLPEGAGWDEAGIREAIKDVDVAGFPVNVISRAQAVELTGKDAAAGYGGFFYRGQIYIVADNVTRGGVADLQRMVREEVGHGLLRTPEGLRLITEALREGELRLTKAERDALLAKGYQPHQLLDEFIAQAASQKLGWWQNIVETVRAYLSKLGLKLTNEETARLLVKRIRNARPDAQGNIPGERFVASNAVITSPDVTAAPAIVAHHGTPHTIKGRFSTDKIGTGEGAQVYGWGLYFAENEKVATQYQKNLTEKEFIGKVRELYDEFSSPEEALTAINDPENGFSEGQRNLLKALQQEDWLGFDYPHQAVQAAIREPKNVLVDAPLTREALKTFGNKYTVSLDVNPDELLDWDKPLSGQSEKVKAVMERLGFDRDSHRGWGYSGEEIYHYLYGYRDQENMPHAVRRQSDPKKVSENLASLGIKGIRYLDQGSRKTLLKIIPVSGKSEFAVVEDNDDAKLIKRGFKTRQEAQAFADSQKTYNYVIFDDSVIKITHENGQPVSVQDAIGEGVSQFEQTAVAPSQPTQLSAEEIERINRELNRLQEKEARSAKENARIRELEKMLGQRDLFEAVAVDAEAELKRRAQREEIARRQSKRLVAGQIEDQGGLFAPKGETKQADMFSVPPPKTEAPPAPKTAANAFGDLFGELAPSRAQFRGVKGIGAERGTESIGETRAAIKERVFNATPAVTDERTDAAWRIANELTEEVTKAGHALRYRSLIGGQEMGLPLLKDEVVRYAIKLAAAGNDSLLRFSLDSRWQTITGGDESTAGRVNRAARELSDSPAFAWLQETMGRERAAAVEAGARVLPQETFLQLVRDMENLQLNPDELESFLNRARDAQGNGFADIVAEATAQGQAPQQPGVPRQPRQRGAQSPALPGMEQETDEEAENAAQNTANRILEQLQIRHAGVEWLRPDANLDAVREIVRISLRGRLGYAETDPTIDPILDDPTRIIEKIQQALENVGVETETARALGREIESERQNRWANRRVRQIERAARSNSVRSLIEDILNTPYRAQHDPAWRRQMAIRWFESNGLSREQATAAADMFNREFEAAYQRAAEKVAARVLRDGAPKTNEQFERLIRSGVLDPSKPWLDKFAEASGWVKPTPEQFQKIAELEEKLADPALSPSEVADIIEQQRTILRHVGKKDGAAMRAMGESFTASLLSQAVSFGRTFWVQFAPVFSILKDFSTAVAFDPKNALNFASALVTAYKKQGKSQLKFGWQKDAFQFHINDITGSHNELQRVYEETRRLVSSPTVSRSRKAVAVVQQVYAFQRFVFRVMNTIDNMQMSIGREWKIVYYSSLAFKDAGINSPQKISELIDAMNSIRQSEFDRARDAGLDEATANVRADHRATQAALDFVSKEAGSDYAMKVLQAAENDAYNVVGRRSPGIGPKDEGMISNYGPNQLMEFASNLRKQGGVGNIVATMSVGMINIPLRAARAATDLHGYGLIRYGIWKYRNNRGLENHWKQSFANELQAKHRRNVAITGLVTAVVTGLLASSTADDDANDKDKNGLFVTGSGPKSKNLRDEWIKNGWSPYTLHVVISGVKAAKIPLTRVGEPLYPAFMMAGVRDNVEWAKKDAVAKGKEINVASVYAQNLIAAHAQLLGARGLFQSVNQFGNLTEGGGGLEKNLARMIGGTAAAIVIPFKSALSQISEMVTGPLDNSSAEAILKNQVPNFGLWSKPAVNRFGDALYNQTLSGKLERLGIPFTLQIPSDSTNDKLYGTLINKGIAPPELRRYVLEEKFGDLTDSQFSDFARKSGALLKQSAVSNLNDIQRMSPTEAKRFLQNAAERADKTAAAALGLERREKPQAATTTSPAASAPAPAASATSSASTSTGGGGSSRASASGRIRKSLASFKVPRLKKVGGRIRSRISRGFKRIKAKTGRIRGRISYRRRMPRIRYAI